MMSLWNHRSRLVCPLRDDEEQLEELMKSRGIVHPRGLQRRDPKVSPLLEAFSNRDGKVCGLNTGETFNLLPNDVV